MKKWTFDKGDIKGEILAPDNVNISFTKSTLKEVVITIIRTNMEKE